VASPVGPLPSERQLAWHALEQRSHRSGRAVSFGQRVEAWTVEAEVNKRLTRLASGTTIGRKRIVRFEPLASRHVRVVIEKARGCPVLAGIEVYDGRGDR